MFHHQTLCLRINSVFTRVVGEISTSTRWVNLHHIKTSGNSELTEQRIPNFIWSLIIMQIDSEFRHFSPARSHISTMFSRKNDATFGQGRISIIFMPNDEGYVQCSHTVLVETFCTHTTDIESYQNLLTTAIRSDIWWFRFVVVWRGSIKNFFRIFSTLLVPKPHNVLRLGSDAHNSAGMNGIECSM